jgi:hypothetical protein
MPDTRKHRGHGSHDPTWFGAEAVAGLRAAVADLSWFLSRGYLTCRTRWCVNSGMDLGQSHVIAAHAKSGARLARNMPQS